MPQKCGAQAFGLPPLIHNVTPFYQHVETLQNTGGRRARSRGRCSEPFISSLRPPELDPSLPIAVPIPCKPQGELPQEPPAAHARHEALGRPPALEGQHAHRTASMGVPIPLQEHELWRGITGIEKLKIRTCF